MSVDPDCRRAPTTSTSSAPDDLFNYQPYNHLVTPNERINVFAKGEYDVTDNVMFRALASFNNRQSQGRAAPVPLFFGVEGGLGFYMDNYLWPANHPFNVFGIDLEGNTNRHLRDETADRGGTAHLQPGRGYLVSVGWL